MSTSATDAWSSTRESFANQFEKCGRDYIYRKSQKGEAFRVSVLEHDRFLEQFNRNLRRAAWIMYVAIAVTLGAVVLVTLHADTDLTLPITVGSIALAMIPYVLYFRWAWAAPARELAGRAPVAGERSPDEVRRLRFQQITYGQLAVAAIGGLAIPFIGGARQDVFSGWNRLWLVFGGALVLVAAVRAFRKWRFEQEDSYRNVIPRSSNPDIAQPTDDSGSSRTRGQLWSYVPLAAFVLALAFIGLTPAGKQLARTPSFWPIVMIGVGGWSLFTVARGLTKGQIEPFARGFYNTYRRETQPKPFWASMTWNAIFGCFCLWLAFTMSRNATAQPIRDRCHNDGHKHLPQEVISACDQLIAGRVSLGRWTRADIFVDRGIAYSDLRQPERAVADYSAAIRLQPRYPEAYYDRALAYQEIGDVSHALRDYGYAIQQAPKNSEAYFRRGLVYLDKFRFDDAIADFSRSHALNPKDPWPLANRGMAYAWNNDRTQAERDFEMVKKIDPANRGVLHGEAILSMNAGDLEVAIARLTTALKLDPSDAWALQTRSDAYQQAGDFTNARADRDQLRQLMSATEPPPPN